jgi:hypothetical protein
VLDEARLDRRDGKPRRQRGAADGWQQFGASMPEAIEPIAVVTEYAGLVTALRQRIVELGTHMEAVDEVAGLPLRYTSKLMSANNQTSLGRVSLGPLLGALALKLAVVPDDDALASLRHRLRQRGPRGPKLTDAAHRRRARELAAALAKLRKGQRRRGAVTSVCGPSQSDVTCSDRPGAERQGNHPAGGPAALSARP